MIKPICYRCKKELDDYGAILLSPPDGGGRVYKGHICKECYVHVKHYLSGLEGKK
jgi:hypothetical protein